MKRVFATICAMGLASAAWAADPVEGVWKTEVDDGRYAHVAIKACGAKICGVFQQTFDANGPAASDVIGKQLLWDMNPEGGGKYSTDKSGRIWRPSNDKTYKSKMELKNANTLIVQGCVGPICPKQTWTRVK